MSAALGLYRLQHVDSQMDQIHGRLKAIQETLQNDRELRAAMDAFSASENESKTAERAFKSTGADVEKQRIKIELAESSLYGGYTTPRNCKTCNWMSRRSKNIWSLSKISNSKR